MVRKNTPEDAVFITPNQQQTFKWYAHRSEVVSWKDTPQDNESIKQWRKRLDILFFPQQKSEVGILCYNDSELRNIALQFGADYIVMMQRQYELVEDLPNLDKPGFERVYPEDADEKSTYIVLKIN